MNILGVETTCDETSASVVINGKRLVSNVVASSLSLHKKYGGVVPEVAAREQVKVIIPVIKKALVDAGMLQHDLDAIAVAHGPGLAGSLLVGVETTKVLATVWDLPLVPINHLIGHIYANWVSHGSKNPEFPIVALIVSGGHTDLILMKGHGKYQWLGGTLDDAAGEAFDKVARVLGLGYPGGPEIERVSKDYGLRTTDYRLPRPMINEDNFDFSFSGIKTAVANIVHGSQFTVHSKSKIAAEFQNAVVDVLVEKTIRAAKKFMAKEILVGGGVAANSQLRQRMSGVGSEEKINVRFPTTNLSVDNGAMIAAAAFYNFRKTKAEMLQANPGLYFE